MIARQHGRPIFAMTLNFQVPEDGLDHQDPMPDVPAPEDCPSLAEASPNSGRDTEEWEREWAALEVRHAGHSGSGGGIADDAVAGARATVDPGQRDRCPTTRLSHLAAFTYASDMTLLGATLVPHGRYIGSPGMQAASLDHTHLVPPAVPGRRVVALRPGDARRPPAAAGSRSRGCSARTAGWSRASRRKASSGCTPAE